MTIQTSQRRVPGRVPDELQWLAGRSARARARADELDRASARLLAKRRLETTTDALTGLANRSRLLEDAERQLRLASSQAPVVLAVFDLNGLAGYDDAFGHEASDALLARLGSRLRVALPDYATAYRTWREGFCVLGLTTDVDSLLTEATTALREEGEWFSIDSAGGYALVPDEAATLTAALRLADRRMLRRGSAQSVGLLPRDFFTQLLTERDRGISPDPGVVTTLAVATATRLDLRDEDVVCVQLAAELHDVGKVAIPAAILDKPATLDPAEWEFVRHHPLIGERILASAPALSAAAPLVRASHERVDGNGYPYGLAKADIPLAARIVAVADAFDAMVSDRPYREALSPADAVTELRECAGTQFDPDVVDAFATVAEPELVTAA